MTAPVNPTPEQAPVSMEEQIVNSLKNVRFGAPPTALESDPAPGPTDPAPAAEPEPTGVPADDTTPEGDEPTDGEPEPEPELETFEVKGPGRQLDEEVTIVAADKESADVLAMWRNGYLRGNQAREVDRQLAQREERLATQQDTILADPVNYLVERLDQPEAKRDVVLALLAQPGVFELIGEELEGWTDPNTRRARVAEIRSDYLARRDDVRAELDDRRMMRAAARDYVKIAKALAPERLDQSGQTIFIQDVLEDIRRAAAQTRQGFIHPRDVVRVIRPRLQIYGMTDTEIEQALAVFRSSPPAPKEAPAAGQRPPVKLTGKARVEAKQRRDAATAAPPGAGAPVTRGSSYNPKDTIEQRIARIEADRQQRAAPR